MPAADRPELTLTAPNPAALADAAAALPDDRLPAAVRELAELAADELRRADAGLAPADCRRLGVRLAARLTDQYGGATYYWPKSDALQRAIRDLTLWAEHDGTVDGPAGIRATSPSGPSTTAPSTALPASARPPPPARARPPSAACAPRCRWADPFSPTSTAPTSTAPTPCLPHGATASAPSGAPWACAMHICSTAPTGARARSPSRPT